MMVRIPFRGAAALIAYLLVAATASTQSLVVSGQAQPGTVLQVTVPAVPWVDAVEVHLSTAGRIVSRTWAFSRYGWERSVALIGIPSWIEPGDYQIHAYLYSGDTDDFGLYRVRELRVGVQVVGRAFRRERIALTSALTAIRQDDSEERRLQTIALSELLYTTDVEAIYSLGKLAVPVITDRITSQFGDRRTFVYADGNEAGAIHHGIDFAAPTGTPVVAAAGGRIAMAKHRVVTGNTVVIEHLPGVYSLYYHLDSLSATVNQVVRGGQAIGTVGSTGLSTGPHLHWELRVAGVPVDPEPYLSLPVLDFRDDYSTLGVQD